MKLPRHPEAFAAAAVALAVVVTLALGLIEFRLRKGVVESAGWITHTLEVERDFEALLAVEDDAQAGGARAQLANLLALTADNPSQQARLALMAPMLGRGEDAERLRAAIGDGVGEEQDLLVTRQAEFQSSVATRGLLIWGLIAFNACALGGLLWMMWRVQRLESIATVCAESRTIQYDNEWLTFDEYLRRRFRIRVTHGLSPTEADRLMAEIEKSQFFERR
ncbi:MAG TPA: hypothetical protein VHZ73_02455 [Vicinamibacterales bacterium]|jgi:hypothetical protein|nr:hypothetical protein [Vicinamibacterales bacterium]